MDARSEDCAIGEGAATVRKNNLWLNEHKRKARERFTSELGLEHRSKRPIEPEAVFGQMKFNMAYRRFRHFGKDKVKMDYAFIAIAFKKNGPQKQLNPPKVAEIRPIFAYSASQFIFTPRESNILGKITKTSRLRYIAFSDSLLSKRACHIFINTYPPIL